MKNITLLGLLVLVVSMTFSGIPMSVHAQSDFSAMLNIANHAKLQVENQLSSLDETNDEAEKLLIEGTEEVELLEQAIDEGNAVSAKEHFLSAMKTFKKIMMMILDKQPTKSGIDTVPQWSPISGLERMKKHIDHLMSIAERHNAEIDFTEIDRLISTAEKQIEEKHFEDARKTIAQLEDLLVEVKKSLRDLAHQNSSDKSKNYAYQYLEKIDRLISYAKKQGSSDEIITTLEQARERLSMASDSEQVIKEIKNIISIKKKFDLTKSDKIESNVMKVEKMLERLSQDTDSNSDSIKDAQETLNEIKELLANGDLHEAKKLLKELVDNIRNIKNSGN